MLCRLWSPDLRHRAEGTGSMALRKKIKKQTDVPVIDVKALLYIHAALFTFLVLWAWLDWSLPQ